MSGGWNTIESDAGVFTSLIENLGVRGVQFEELLTLEPSELASLQPLYGVIFLFKWASEGPRSTSPADGTFDDAACERLFFASQTIQNACATQALLGVILNQTGTGVDLGPQLREFREFSMMLPADIRGEALGNSELIRSVHNGFARSSPFVDETTRGDGGEEDVFHFIAYTCVDGTLYELDGLQRAPISHGGCDGESFPGRVAEVLRRRVGRYDEAEIRFNLLAVCRDLRVRARETGDAELERREGAKRRGWAFENALRRHNFVGFAGGVLREVVGGLVGRRGVGEWVEGGMGRRREEERALNARKKGGGD